MHKMYIFIWVISIVIMISKEQKHFFLIDWILTNINYKWKKSFCDIILW